MNHGPDRDSDDGLPRPVIRPIAVALTTRAISGAVLRSRSSSFSWYFGEVVPRNGGAQYFVALSIGAVDDNRLDVDDRRAVDGLDRSDPQPSSGDLAHGHAM